MATGIPALDNQKKFSDLIKAGPMSTNKPPTLPTQSNVPKPNQSTIQPKLGGGFTGTTAPLIRGGSGGGGKSSPPQFTSGGGSTGLPALEGGQLPPPQSMAPQSQANTLQRQNAITEAQAKQADQNYSIKNVDFRKSFEGGFPAPGKITLQTYANYEFNRFGNYLADTYATPVLKNLKSSPLSSPSERLIGTIGLSRAFQEKKYPAFDITEAAKLTVFPPLAPRGIKTLQQFNALGLQPNTATAFVSPVERINLQSGIQKVSSSFYNFEGREISRVGETTIIGSNTARSIPQFQLLTKASTEITPLTETSAEAFTKGTTGINFKSFAGTTFTANQNIFSMARITNIEKVPLSFVNQKGSSITVEGFRGNVEGITNLKAGQGGTSFKYIAGSQEKEFFNNVLGFRINPIISKGGLSYQSERFIPVAGKAYSPMKITTTAKEGLSIDLSNLKLQGGGKIYKMVEPEFSSIKIMSGNANAFKPTSISGKNQFISQLSANINKLSASSPARSLGGSIAPEIQSRQIASLSVPKPSFSPTPSIYAGTGLYERTDMKAFTIPSINFRSSGQSLLPQTSSRTFNQFLNAQMTKLDTGISNTNKFYQTPIVQQTTNTNQGTGLNFASSSMQIPTFNIPPFTPTTGTPFTPIISPPIFTPGTGGGYSFLPELPSLGGYAISNPRSIGRKSNAFNISPGFSSIVQGIKIKNPIKVSKTFGVTPFQTRGILTGKKARKGQYFQLTDL